MKSTTRPGDGKPAQIATELAHDIRSGALGFGERLQSESELVQRFAVSRSTVRKGLEQLSTLGLITTRVGIGSFVTYDGRTMDDALGWSRALADAGAKAETRILRIEILEDAALAETLGLPSPLFIAVDRLRVGMEDACGLSLERSRLPLSRELESLPLQGLREGSLHATLREAGLVANHGEEWVDVEKLSQEDAALLGCTPGTAFLRTLRLTRTVDRRPIEHVTSLLNPAHFALHLEF